MSDYTEQLKIENKKLEKEIQKKQSNSFVYERVNDYYLQDDVLIVYIQKMLTILYGAIYFFFLYFLYTNPEKYSNIMSVFYLILFAVFPFIIFLLSRFFYSSFIQIMHLFTNGNSAYLYTDAKIPRDSK
jgi:hypothetical protein